MAITVAVEVTRTGMIYALERPDLNLVYVGQTVNRKRIDRHFRQSERGMTVFTALCGDGERPDIIILDNEAALPESQLDQRERDRMISYLDAGWTLVNRAGPDSPWWPGRTQHELAIESGRKRGQSRARNLHAARMHDAVLDAWWRGVASLGGKAVQEKRRADPEFDAQWRESALRGSRRGVEMRRKKRLTDPEWADRERAQNQRKGRIGGRAGGRVTATKRVQCVECGRVSTPGGIGMHQSSTRHQGRLTMAQVTQMED
jgi:hypothetical protein